MNGRYYEIQSMSRRYASYWDAFLFMTYFHRTGGPWPPRPPPLGSATEFRVSWSEFLDGRAD